MKLNSFGETIRSVEAERMAEATAAVAAGWTEAAHPDKCCPAGPTTKGPVRTHEQRAQYARDRAVNAESRASDDKIRLERLNITSPEPNDRAQANIPWSRKRDRSVERTVKAATERIRLTEAIMHHESRAKYWRAQEDKWS